MERTYKSFDTPNGCVYVIIEYIKFDDESRALRFWYELWDSKTKKFKIGRGMYIKEEWIKAFNKDIEETFAIKELLRMFIK